MVLGVPLLDSYVCPSAVHSFSTTVPSMFYTMIAHCLLNKQYCYSRDYSPNLKNDDEFDFIVVGSGPGGATVANRISENSNVRVLLVEAGREPSVISDIPYFCLTLQKTFEDWQYLTQPSKYNCLGFKGGQCRVPRGKALGGSSTIDLMIYARGNKLDYDTWAALGNDGWDYDTMINYNKKAEMVVNTDSAKTGLFGTTGALFTDVYDSSEPIINLTKRAALELGYESFKTQPLIGYYESLSSIKDGTRYSSAKAYLSPIKDRKNIFMAMNSFVTKIIINSITNTAEGVEIFTSGKTIRVKATKEVVLSAGAINSPQLLMLSGIGPKEHLTEMGIPIIKDLPVGKNLNDHIMFLGLAINVSSDITKLKNLIEDGENFMKNSKGPFSQTNILNFIMLLNVSNTSQNADVMVKHMIFDKSDSVYYTLAANSVDQNDETTLQELEYISQSTILKFIPVLLNMTSRGEIKLKNKNPFEKPLIYPGYYTDSDGRDIEKMYKTIKYLTELLKTETFSAYNTTFLKPGISGCDKFKFATEEYWKCALRHTSMTDFQQVGTCKMGPANDPGAVVNAKLEVYGINKLRIVDGSIMPELISTFTVSTITGIAEKAADMIKLKWSI